MSLTVTFFLFKGEKSEDLYSRSFTGVFFFFKVIGPYQTHCIKMVIDFFCHQSVCHRIP